MCNRSQAVRLGKSISSFVQVTSGIFQGTILGPILFILYIDGVFDMSTNKLELFADDANLYRSVLTCK